MGQLRPGPHPSGRSAPWAAVAPGRLAATGTDGPLIHGGTMNALIQQLQQIYVLLEDGDRRALRPVGLTPTQFALLRCLDDGPEEELNVTQVAGSLLCTRGNVTRLVRRLQNAGLVSTRGNDRDQRLVYVFLTPDGRRRLRLARRSLDVADQRRLAHLAREDIRTMTRLAEELAAGLRRDLDELGRADAPAGTDAAHQGTAAAHAQPDAPETSLTGREAG